MKSATERTKELYDFDMNNAKDQARIAISHAQLANETSDDRILRWLIEDNQPFASIETAAFKNMLCHQRIPSRHTIERRLNDSYKGAIGPVTEHLKTARGKIHFTFDGWTSRNRLALLGLHAYFVDEDFELQKLVLGLPPIAKKHTGDELAEQVIQILHHFDISKDKIGIFVLDNASNNDTAMEAIGNEYEFSPEEKRLRCMGHIINLAVQDFLFAEVAGEIEQDQNESTRSHAAWRKRGPVGKAHVIVRLIAQSAYFSDLIKQWQRDDLASGALEEEGPDGKKVFTLSSLTFTTNLCL